nr:dihydrolipoyllysine-residue acetyltransferase [Ignatzschineria sp. RMDPL8A]
MAKVDLIVPDIGNFDDVDVIEILANVGDTVAIDDPILTLESDKASMDVPADKAGTITEILVKIGDKIKEGDVYARIDMSAVDAPKAEEPSVEAPKADAPVVAQEAPQAAPAPVSAAAEVIELRVPDIGNFDEVDVIEVLASAGDRVELDQPLLTLESDKASMDVPAEKAGVIESIVVNVGDKIKEGDLIGTLKVEGAAPAAAAQSAPAQAQVASQAAAPARTESIASVTGVFKAPHPADPIPEAPHMPEPAASVDISTAHASPSVRAFARELGADLNQVKGSGRKGRILRDDVTLYIKNVLSGKTQLAGAAAPQGASYGGGLDLLPWPKVDFAKFGEIEEAPLSRIKKISGANLARNWAMIPHVAQFDEADITSLEALRKQLNKEFEREGARLTILAFLVKACVKALQKFPEFNSSLDGDKLILKKYYHIGFAADTPNGLVVPVIRDCDKKGVIEIAAEMRELAGLARDGKLKPDQMQGGTFTISSLGGIGGTNFIPIINAPEVAILGVSRNETKPVWNGKEFEPRLMLPLSLSYDHRVIDGALGARFIVYLNALLTDMRRALI